MLIENSVLDPGNQSFTKSLAIAGLAHRTGINLAGLKLVDFVAPQNSRISFEEDKNSILQSQRKKE